jgi:3-deoxy-D-manno-octulosonic-acid transferase
MTSPYRPSIPGRAAIALYRGATSLAAPAIQLLLARRRSRGKEDPARIGERVGKPGLPRPEGLLVWMHAASIGEAFSVLRLIERLRADRPELHVLVTTGTVTSALLMVQRLPQGAVHQFVPVDRLAWVRRFLDHWHPDLALWIESEFWPNLLNETAARGIPMMLVNARMSPRSFARWLRFKPVFEPLIRNFAICLAQDEDEANRLRALGAQNVKVAGNLKHAASPLPFDEAQFAALSAAMTRRPRWIAASTHDGEEAAAGNAHRVMRPRNPGLLTIIVPRHPERAEMIAAMLRSSGLNVARRSLREPITARTDIYLADTLGELGLFYRLAPIAFVGGSLVPRGGQNLLEPARLGCAVLAGPHLENFPAITEEMTAAGALRRVESADALGLVVGHLLTNEAARRELSEAAIELAATKDDVLERVVTEIDSLLPEAPHQDGGKRTPLAVP